MPSTDFHARLTQARETSRAADVSRDGNANNTAIGTNAQAGLGALGQTNNTAIGFAAAANGIMATAVGTNSFAAGSNSAAFGAGSSAGGPSGKNDPNTNLPIPFNTSNTTAIGVGAQAGSTADGQNNATALGQAAQANALNATAIGQGAVANAINSVAIGQGSIASQPNTVSVGAPGAERRITNVAAGVNPTDAVNVGQLEAALAGAPVVGGGGGVTPAAITGLQNEINGLAALTRRFRDESRQGVAAAVAMGSAPMPSAPGRTTWAGNTSLTNGAAGVGGSVAHRFDTVIPLAVSAGYAYGGNKTHVARVGVQGEF
jgi:hypothetical protein